MEKFQKIAKKWIGVQDELRRECIEFLKRVLQANNNHLEWDDSELDSSVCVTYDGGNHPEYASNAFSTVTAIDLNKDGFITLEIEDCPEYWLDDVSTDEVWALCDFIDKYLLPKE